MKVNCVDISTWNTGVNYRAVRSDGIIAAILRAGYGRETSQEDSRFETHYKGCRDAGLKVGVYWYSYADSVDDAEQEARACLSVLGGRHLDLPVYFDMEESWQTSMGRGTLTAMAKRFCDTIEAGGYRAGVYSNLNWFGNYLNYDALRARYSIWLAQWSGSINSAIIDGGSPSAGGDEVRQVQQWLNSTFDAGLEEDGVYGSHTNQALVKALQTELNENYGARLVVDGVFGPRTKQAVRNLGTGDTGDYVKVLQGFLLCHGYDTGGFDGIFGGRTENAVTSFQKARGLYADGIAGPYTFEELCR